MADRFQESEDIGRNLFKKWVPTQFPVDKYKVEYQFTKDKYAAYDVFLTVINLKSRKQKDYVVEIKVRSSKYGSQLLEQDKHKRLLLQADNEDAGCLYVCFTNEVVLPFDLHKIPQPVWHSQQLIHNTCDPSKGDKQKMITYIPNKFANFIF